MGNEREAKLVITAEERGVAAAMSQATTAVRQGVGQMKDKFEQLSGVGESLKAQFIAIGAVLAGGRIFQEAVVETMNLTKESIELGRQIGVTATQASILKVALDDVYVSQETMEAASNRIAQTLRTDEKAFSDLGVKTRDANGHFRTTFDIMQDVNKRLREFKEGTDRNVEGQKIYGRGWAEIQPILKLTEQGMDAAREKAEALGLAVGQDGVVQANRYRAAMNDVGDVTTGLKKAIGDQLIPVLADFGEWMSADGPQEVSVMRTAIASLLAAFYGIKLIVEEVFNVVKAAIQEQVTWWLMFSDVVKHALHFDFKGAKDAFVNGMQQMRDIGTTMLHDIVSDWENSQNKIAGVFERAFSKQAPATESSGGGAETSAGGKPTKTPKADGRFAEWQSELEKIKTANGDYRKDDLAGDLLYWQQKLAMISGNTEKDKALRLKVEHEIFDLKRQLAGQERALAEEEIAQKQAIAEGEIEDKREQLRAMRELGQITEAQEILALKQLQAQKYDIERQAIEQRRRLAEADVVARRKLDDEVLRIQQRHLLDARKADNDAAIARKKQWEATLAPISNAISASVQGMIQGTLTLRKAVANLGQSIVAEFVSLSARKLTAWVAGELAMTSATTAGTAIRTTLEQTASKQSILATAGAAIKKIAIRAVEVMASVYSAIAGIPYVGPFLAPAMAIAAGATVAGYIGRIASARGGYDIPSGVNPITQLHEKEMVLPAKYAETIRGMAEGGRGMGGGATHYHISALDARSFEQALRRNGSSLAKVMRELGNNRFVPVS